MNKPTLDVSILLPCYNEEAALPSVISEIRAAMENTSYAYEIILINDKSSDNSAKIAKELGCRVINHPVRRGTGAGRKTGILASNGKIIVMLDADGTYDASYIPKMLELFPDHDQVNGARTTEEGTMKWLRQPTKWVIRMLASFLANYMIPDLNTGLKAFKRDIMLHYIWCIPNGFSCVSSMTLAFLCNGHSTVYIPINYRKRIGKSKFHPIKDTLAYVLTVFRLITYFNPLKIFLTVSFLLVGIGVVKSLMDYFFIIGRLQQSDIILIVIGVMIGLQGMLADLIVAQSRHYSTLLLGNSAASHEE